MKKLILILSLLFLINSCEDDFSPLGDYKEDYVLSAVLQGDTLVQTITISKNYKTGSIPISNVTQNLWINGAEVTLAFDEDAYKFDEVNNSISKYEINNFDVPIDKLIKIEALLPNGRWLRAYTKTPKEVVFKGFSDQYLPPDDGRETYSIIWQSFERDVNFIPKITLEYYISVNGNFERHEIEIPQEFINSNGELKPVYPVPTNQIGTAFQMDALEKVLKNIYKSEFRKQDYYISKALRFELIILDQNLTSYYLITNNILDNYSVRLNESEYSNIEGGLGIFGSFIKQNYYLYLTEEYINSFGYRIKTN